MEAPFDLQIHTQWGGGLHTFSVGSASISPQSGGGGGGIYETGYVVFLATVHLRVFLATL